MSACVAGIFDYPSLFNSSLAINALVFHTLLSTEASSPFRICREPYHCRRLHHAIAALFPEQYENWHYRWNAAGMRQLLTARRITRLRGNVQMAARVLRYHVGVAGRLLCLTARVLVVVLKEPLFWVSLGLMPLMNCLRGQPYNKLDLVCYCVSMAALDHVRWPSSSRFFCSAPMSQKVW